MQRTKNSLIRSEEQEKAKSRKIKFLSRALLLFSPFSGPNKIRKKT
jgi:hypothetical protein